MIDNLKECYDNYKNLYNNAIDIIYNKLKLWLSGNGFEAIYTQNYKLCFCYKYTHYTIELINTQIRLYADDIDIYFNNIDKLIKFLEEIKND